MIGADIGSSTGNVANSGSGKTASPNPMSTCNELSPCELSTELDVNTVVLIILFDRRPFDRLAIKDNAVVLRDFADVTEDCSTSRWQRNPASKIQSFVGRWVSPVTA